MRIRLLGLVAGMILSAGAFSSVAWAQANQGGAGAAARQGAAKPAPAPAPVRDLTGVWNGPVNAGCCAAPPMTELGQKLFSANAALRCKGCPGTECKACGGTRQVVVKGAGFDLLWLDVLPEEAYKLK